MNRSDHREPVPTTAASEARSGTRPTGTTRTGRTWITLSCAALVLLGACAPSGSAQPSGPIDLGANNTLSIGAANLAAGDSLQRLADLKNTGPISLAGAALTVTATNSSNLDTDPQNGLHISIDRCSDPWTQTSLTYTYACAGTINVVMTSRPLTGSSLPLCKLNTKANADNYLRVTVTLPDSASANLQNQASVVSYHFSDINTSASTQCLTAAQPANALPSTPRLTG